MSNHESQIQSHVYYVLKYTFCIAFLHGLLITADQTNMA
jgi:hypothetical protein